MSIKNNLEKDIKTSLLSGDKLRVSVLKMLKAAIQTEEIRIKGELRNDDILKVLQQEHKRRRDAAKLYIDNSEDERSQKELNEAKIVAEYLPQPMTKDEVMRIIDEARGVHGDNIGLIIKTVIEAGKGRIDGAMVAELVRSSQ